MFYKDFLDYDTQLRAEVEERVREESWAGGKAEGILEAIKLAIQGNAPISLIEAMAQKANLSPKRLDELMSQVATS